MKQALKDDGRRNVVQSDGEPATPAAVYTGAMAANNNLITTLKRWLPGLALAILLAASQLTLACSAMDAAQHCVPPCSEGVAAGGRLSPDCDAALERGGDPACCALGQESVQPSLAVKLADQGRTQKNQPNIADIVHGAGRSNLFALAHAAPIRHARSVAGTGSQTYLLTARLRI